VASYATWRLPFAISREAVVADPARPGSVVLAGGMLPGDASSARAVEVDPATGRTQPLPPLATPVHDAAGGLFRGKPAVFGGGNATEQSVVQVLTGSSWRQPAHLPTTRSDLSVVSAAGSTLVIGGYDGSATPRDVLRVGADGALTRVGRLDQGVRYAATAVVGSDVYVFGGEVNHQELDAVQQLDAKTGRTRIVGRLPHGLGHASAVTVGGRVLVLGGRTGPQTLTDVMWWFDPARGSWHRAGQLPAATSDAAVVASGDHVWLLGGESPNVTDRVIVVQVS
jgi:N-acetylneuraminic acid mutarotase